jgi:hypothetical protein
MTHEWLEVGDRRWCLGCSLFQAKPKGAVYFPTPRKPCPRNTPYAHEKDSRWPVSAVPVHVRG